MGTLQTAHQPLPTPAKQRGSTDLLVLRLYYKVPGQTRARELYGGAVPATLPLHDDTPTATDIVIHVGTKSVNNSNEQPHEIADSILQCVTSTRGVNPDAKIFVASVIQRTDLIDENGTTHGLDENGTTHGLDENGTTHGLDENGTTHGLDENGTTHGLDENGTTHGLDENGTTHGPNEKIKAANELLLSIERRYKLK